MHILGSFRAAAWRRVFVAGLLAWVPLAAQEFRGAITGTITDPQGAPIAAAAVEARNIDTGTVEKTATNASGIYVLPYLTVGHYSLTASAPGFKQALRSNIELRIGDRLQIDFSMQLGVVSEQVTVSGESDVLETTNAMQGQVIDSKTIGDMPLLGRNPVMLTLLSTGILWANPQPSQSERPWDNNGMENFNMNGSQGLTSRTRCGSAPREPLLPPPRLA